MKRLFALIFFVTGIITMANAQKVEMLFFRGELTCCAARACNALEEDLKELIRTKFPNGSVVYRTIGLTDESNAELVKRFNAKNQTVVVVKGSSYEDLTGIVAAYSRNKNKPLLENEVAEKINKILK